MLIAPVVLAALAAIPQLGKLFAAGVQGKRANELTKSLVRPEQTVPKSVTEATDVTRDALGLAKMFAANPFLPGQSRTEEKIASTTANALAATKEYGGVKNPVGILRTETEALKDLGVASGNLGLSKQNLVLSQMGELTSQLNKQGIFEQDNFDYNKKQPYAEGIAAAARLREAAGQNAMSGIDNATAIALMGLGLGKEAKTSATGTATPAGTSPTDIDTTGYSTYKGSADLSGLSDWERSAIGSLFKSGIINPELLKTLFGSRLRKY